METHCFALWVIIAHWKSLSALVESKKSPWHSIVKLLSLHVVTVHITLIVHLYKSIHTEFIYCLTVYECFLFFEAGRLIMFVEIGFKSE